MIDLKERQEYINAIKNSYNWKAWLRIKRGDAADLMIAALDLKPWLIDRPSLRLTKIEEKAGLKKRKLNTLKCEDTILSPQQFTMILPVLAPLGFSCTPKKSSSIKQFLIDNKELISFAGLEKEAKINLFTIDNHINKNFAMSPENKKKLIPILKKYGYQE